MTASRLTYCSNIHLAESWSEVRRALETHVPEIKARCCPDSSFPLGVWISHQALTQCEVEGPEQFGRWCEEAGCHVLTLNGFPFGRFHLGTVKSRVYLPDWRDPRRADYTVRLATLLDSWLPAGEPGSISTVPLGWGPHLADDDLGAVTQNLRTTLEHLDRLRQRSGKEILLALEPEPGCRLQTTDDVVAFFGDLDLPPALRSLLGLCYDACHQAVLFEGPEESLSALAQAGVKVAKVQASSALRLMPGAAPACLRPFAEDRYLHQTVISTDEGTLAYADLPEALDAHPGPAVGEWRVHMHVPVFLEDLGEGLATTRPFLEQVLDTVDPAVPVEVETYTFSVLPEELRAGSVEESIVRELTWVQSKRQEEGR